MKHELRSSLPRFSAPPVVEVSIGVVFSPLPISVTELPTLFETYGDRYPNTEAMLPLRSRVDTPIGSGFRVEFADDPGIPRIRFTSDEHDRWIEAQSDSLTCGWRRRTDAEYPSYQTLREDFRLLALQFAGFVDRFHPDDDIYIVDASVEYKNRFDMGDLSASEALSEAFVVPRDKDPFTKLPPLSTTGLNFRFDFEHEGDVYARLLARASMEARNGNTTGWFNLRFAGDPYADSEDADGFEAILTLLDEGHTAVVTAFEQATTATMHKIWGKQER